MGLDFFGGPPSAKPANTSSTPSGPSRPDLKQSILSLYASAPRPQTQPQHERQSSFGGMQQPQQQSSYGGLDDAFSGLTFTSTASPPVSKAQEQSKPNPFAALDKPASQRSTLASPQLTSPKSSGGGFFDTSSKPAIKPVVASKPPNRNPQGPPDNHVSLGFADLSAAATKSSASKPSPGSNLNDLFDFSETPLKETAIKAPTASVSTVNSAFNLSAPNPALHAPQKPTSTNITATFSGFSTADPWGSNDAWASSEASKNTTAKSQAASKSSSANTMVDFSSWSNTSSTSGHKSGGSGIQGPPRIAADEDFGGWNSAVPVSPVVAKPSAPSAPVTKPAGSFGGGSEDLFSNVWE